MSTDNKFKLFNKLLVRWSNVSMESDTLLILVFSVPFNYLKVVSNCHLLISINT